MTDKEIKMLNGYKCGEFACQIESRMRKLMDCERFDYCGYIIKDDILKHPYASILFTLFYLCGKDYRYCSVLKDFNSKFCSEQYFKLSVEEIFALKGSIQYLNGIEFHDCKDGEEVLKDMVDFLSNVR